MSRLALLLSMLAALLFTVGGVFMKVSNGLARLGPAVLALALFLGGAVVQTLALERSELGVVYVFVLGLEAVLAFGFGVVFFHERVSLPKVLGVVLIIGGVALLHASGSTAH
jgi:multidrug transporter EmrE-like cation transporter